jgi:hypothetical protein
MSLQWSWYLGENRRPPAEGQDAPTPANDEFWQKVVKTIPVIVVSAYTAAAAIILSIADVNTQRLVFAVAVVIGLAATIGEFTIIRRLNLNDPDRSKRAAARVQVGVGVLAFAVWSYAQADWAVAWDVFQGAIAALLVILMAVIIHFAEAIKKQLEG